MSDRWKSVPRKYAGTCNPQNWARARQMRIQGKLLKQIAYSLGISMWTATRWCNGVRKTPHSQNPRS